MNCSYSLHHLDAVILIIVEFFAQAVTAAVHCHHAEASRYQRVDYIRGEGFPGVKFSWEISA